MKGQFNPATVAPLSYISFDAPTTAGAGPAQQSYHRANSVQPPAGANDIQGWIFRGQQNVDWIDPIYAPKDTLNFKFYYDKVHLIRSGNASGTIKQYTMWHPMRKNLKYADGEVGGDELVRAPPAGATDYGAESSFFSTTGKIGMGDYYVLDIYSPGANAAIGSPINVLPEATLYWHEK